MEIAKVGNNIKKFRELKNLTQEYMANQLEMSQAGYGKIERGETDISLSKIDAIAKVLEVTIYDILEFNEKMTFFGSIINHQNEKCGFIFESDNFEKERKLYEDQIVLLKDEISFLRKLLEK